MLSSVGLEVMNSTNKELNWKIVTKGRRSRKPVRSLNGGLKVGNSISPKRVGDFSGSDCDKLGELALGQSTSVKSKSVPPKKRRHLLQSPPPHPCASQRTGSSSPFSGDHEQLHPSGSLGQRSSNRNKRRVQGSIDAEGSHGFDDVYLYDQTESEYNDTGDFSGIALLAAAASMDADADKANEKDHRDDSSMPNKSDSSSSATLSNVGLKTNESENSSSNTNMRGGNTDCYQERNSASTEDGTVPKVSRHHWDLNTLMDAWEEPCDDSIAGDTINDCVNDTHLEGRQKVSRDHLNSDARGTKDEFSDLKLEEYKSTSVSEEIICSEPLNVMGELQEPSMSIYSVGATDTPGKAGEKDPDAILESSTVTRDVNAHDIPPSGTVIDVQHKETPELLGICTRDSQPAPIGDVNKQNDPVELDAKHEDRNHLNAVKQCDDSTASVGRNGFSVDGQRDGFTGFQEGYDSPYEDGELRGSYLCSWEDNDMENECVDYESDGRNEDDYPASEIVEGGSEASQGTLRSLSVKISPGCKSKNGQQLKQSLWKQFVKDNSDNNEVAGKASNAGSGITVEQCMEMVMEEDDGSKLRQLIDRRDTVDVGKATDISQYASKMTSRGKIQSRIEGRSSANATDGKEVFFMQGFRPRRLGGSYARGEKDVSPDRYMNRYRFNTERDGVNQWGSRRRFNTSNYQGGAEGRNHNRPRNKIGDSGDKIDGPEFHDSRQTGNYVSRGLHRPLTRRSPVERDEYFVGRRMAPITRGVANYRSRGGHYSQRGGGDREFVEDFEPLPDDAGPPVRMPRYFSRRERSFSPRGPPMTNLPRRRSRSRSREWHPNRERILGSRRRTSRSPEFRSEGRIERMRLPFSKPPFASDYVDDYMSPPPRGRFSPQQNCRWVEDRNFGENHVRRRRSPPPPPPPPPARVFRRTARFDGVGSSGRVKSDEYFRPVARSGRFSFMGDRECNKLESNYEDRRREDGGEMMNRALRCDDGGNVRRFRQNGAAAGGGGGGDNFETDKNLNNEDDVPRGDVPG